jgi:hypothetical protein
MIEGDEMNHYTSSAGGGLSLSCHRSMQFSARIENSGENSTLWPQGELHGRTIQGRLASCQIELLAGVLPTRMTWATHAPPDGPVLW